MQSALAVRPAVDARRFAGHPPGPGPGFVKGQRDRGPRSPAHTPDVTGVVLIAPIRGASAEIDDPRVVRVDGVSTILSTVTFCAFVGAASCRDNRDWKPLSQRMKTADCARAQYTQQITDRLSTENRGDRRVIGAEVNNGFQFTLHFAFGACLWMPNHRYFMKRTQVGS